MKMAYMTASFCRRPPRELVREMRRGLCTQGGRIAGTARGIECGVEVEKDVKWVGPLEEEVRVVHLVCWLATASLPAASFGPAEIGNDVGQEGKGGR